MAGAAVPQAGQVHVRRRDDAVPARERAQHRGLDARGRLRRCAAGPHAGGAARWPSRRWCSALRLSPSARRPGPWSGSGSACGHATTVMHEKFGDDAVYVLVRGDLPRIVLTANLNRLLGLEGCLAGNVPRGRDGAGRRGVAVRAAGARRTPVRVVYGPGTFINSAVEELTAQLQTQTRRAGGAGRPGGARRRASWRWRRGSSPRGGAAAGRRGGEARLRAVRAASCSR